MAWSKSLRIKVMLVIDVLFFLLELIAGFAVGSLALTADAFHMLNDILSLLVGLWAVNVATRATTDKYSYGWLRAEILGAFFNAVFLIALCVSILLEALTRFLDPPPIRNPILILVVGCLGLASNLIGFLVLGGHGHSHGHSQHSNGDHAHIHAHGLRNAEEGHAGVGGRVDGVEAASNDEGPVADVLPQAAVARYDTATVESTRRIRFEGADDNRTEQPDLLNAKASVTSRSRGRRRSGSSRHGHLTTIEDITIHPASFRQEIIAASQHQHDMESSCDETPVDGSFDDDEYDSSERSPLMSKDGAARQRSGESGHISQSRRLRRSSAVHDMHNHNKKKTGKGPGHVHGHSHSDMGMNAMVLHVLGDALGNVGVIVTALIIWLTDWSVRFYADPAVSLFITLIILRSAIPLTIAASKILLQATPDNIDLNDVREDIQRLPGVISCHHVHIWQLSDTKIVASLHIQVSFPISEEGGRAYMDLAKNARKCLHSYGIHSATIQPEFCLDKDHDHESYGIAAFDGPAKTLQVKCGKSENGLCLLECVDDCVDKGCCEGNRSGPESFRSDDDHNHHDHDAV